VASWMAGVLVGLRGITEIGWSVSEQKTCARSLRVSVSLAWVRAGTRVVPGGEPGRVERPDVNGRAKPARSSSAQTRGRVGGRFGWGSVMGRRVGAVGGEHGVGLSQGWPSLLSQGYVRAQTVV